jgi:hypothetical protein
LHAFGKSDNREGPRQFRPVSGKRTGKKIVATHYRLTAERPRHVWYDATGRWVKMRTIGRDGSSVEWLLK